MLTCLCLSVFSHYFIVCFIYIFNIIYISLFNYVGGRNVISHLRESFPDAVNKGNF